MTKSVTGGCQCGAVRYRAEAPLVHPHICHCRMCQKAAGNYFMPLANARKQAFTVTRGKIAWFQSSDPVRRGFCRDCGTPLIFETISAEHLNIVLGSLDYPEAVQPQEQFGLEAKMPWLSRLETLPGEITEESEFLEGEAIERIRLSNRQHPDHETEHWTSAKKKP